MYILGGIPVKNGVEAGSSLAGMSSQAFMIDLSVPWEAAHPVYKILGPRRPRTTGSDVVVASAITADQQYLLTLTKPTTKTMETRTDSRTKSRRRRGDEEGVGGSEGSIAGYLYHFKSRTWNQIVLESTIGDALGHLDGSIHQSATDPDTGIIYMLFGGGQIGGGNDGNLWAQTPTSTMLFTIDTRTRTFGRAKNVPPTLAVDGIAWNTYRKDLLYSSSSSNGNDKSNPTDPSYPALLAYNPNDGWRELDAITNPATTAMARSWPIHRKGACFVPAYGGTKMVLFGGLREEDGSALNDIYILDVKTLTWTKGPNISRMNARGYSTCAVSGDNFIAWGGIRSLSHRSDHGQGDGDTVTTTTVADAVVVFSLRSWTWVSRYTPPGMEANPKEPIWYKYTDFKMCLNASHCQDFMIGSAIIGSVILMTLAVTENDCTLVK
ncbi:hypothetical protein BGX31_011671 [Mortierella sp. GBA43]|nr:hypothetical protein BGX31_011671 [Mortierella sp. GBA43]